MPVNVITAALDEIGTGVPSSLTASAFVRRIEEVPALVPG